MNMSHSLVIKATYLTQLFRHTKSVHDYAKFPCDQCDFSAKRKDHLLRHKKSVYEGVKFPCDQCDYNAKCKGHLLSHKKSVHEGLS